MILNIVFQIPFPICNTPLMMELTPNHSASEPVLSKFQTPPKRSAFIPDNADIKLDNGVVTKWAKLPNPFLISSKQVRPEFLDALPFSIQVIGSQNQLHFVIRSIIHCAAALT